MGMLVPAPATSATPAIPLDDAPQRWRILVLLAVGELLGMSLWFAASAVSTALAHDWGLPTERIGWVTSSVQLGFVAGTAFAAALNLADVIPSRRYFAISAFAGAVINASLLGATDWRAALLLRFLTGWALAGVYPPAMKMVSTWFRSARGLAVGTVVGALTVGKATPYLVHALPGVGSNVVVLAGSAAALIASVLIAAFYRDGPYAFPPRRFSWSLVLTVFQQRRWRLATGGYLGHMAELYSFWTWIPAFIAASELAHHGSASTSLVSLLAFLTIAVGGAGCIWGGYVADRRGREWLLTVSMAASGSCAILIGLLFGHALVALSIVALAWGFFVIADSAQFSVLVTESVPPHAVGTALTVQTSLGFLLTTVTIQLVPIVARDVGWPRAFAMLAIGPALGIEAIRRLWKLRRQSASVP